MTLTYRGVKYDQAQEAGTNRSWWNLAIAPGSALSTVTSATFRTSQEVKSNEPSTDRLLASTEKESGTQGCGVQACHC